jgi:hypothetical protein
MAQNNQQNQQSGQRKNQNQGQEQSGQFQKGNQGQKQDQDYDRDSNLESPQTDRKQNIESK